MRKILSLILSIAMVMSCFGVTTFAADETTNIATGYSTWLQPTNDDSRVDTTGWLTASSALASGNTYVKSGAKYAENADIYGADDITAVVLSATTGDSGKAVMQATNMGSITSKIDLTDNDRLHYSLYVNPMSGNLNNIVLMPTSAGGINISENLLGGTTLKSGEWARLDIFYQPKMTYTYTKTASDGSTSTGVWETNTLQNGFKNGTAWIATGGVDYSAMEGYDSTATYTTTKATHGAVSCYVNGELVKDSAGYDSSYPSDRSWDNLAKVSFKGDVTLLTSQGKIEAIQNFDASTYNFVEYPTLASGTKYTVSGSNLIYSEAITAADITAPEGYTVAAFSDAACTQPVTGTIGVGNTVVVRKGAIVSYYIATDGKNVITTTMTSIQRSIHTEYTSSLAGKAAPFTKITKSTADEDNAYFEMNIGSNLPSIDTDKYIVLEMNYLPESAGAYLMFGGQQSTGLGLPTLTTSNYLVQNRWNKIVVVVENGSTTDNPYPANTTSYASGSEAKAASPHKISAYVNGELIADPVNTQFGMKWNNGGRTENFFRIQVLPKNTAEETYCYVDDVVLYTTNSFSAADAALPEITVEDGFSIGDNFYSSAAVADITALGYTVLGKTEGNLEAGDVIAYDDGTAVAYLTVAGGNRIMDKEENANSIGWKLDGTTLRIYDIPEVGTGNLPNGQNQITFPWKGLTGITDVVVEEGITRLGQWTLFATSVDTITFPASINAMDGYTFNNVTANKVIFEEGATGFGGAVLNRDCSITNLYLPSTANVDANFWRGLDTEATDMPYNSKNTTVNIYAPADSAAYEWAVAKANQTTLPTATDTNKTTVTITPKTTDSDRLYTYVNKSYKSSVTINNGAGALAAGASGAAYDTAYAMYSTTESQKNAFMTGPGYDQTLFAKRAYTVFEADVKFAENSGYFFFGTNGHAHISPSVTPSTSLATDGWNKIVTVVDYNTGVANTYVNGILLIESNSKLWKDGGNTGTRFIVYDNGEISETVPALYIDNMAIYATNTSPADAYTAPLTASAYDAATGVTFTASDAVKALDSNIVIAAAYDADDNMVGNVVVGTGAVTIAPVAGATKYVGYVWNSLTELAPIAACVPVNAQ